MKTLLAWVAGVALVVVALFAVLLLGGAIKLVGTNVDRVVTQHTLQYVQTHQKVVLDYYADWVAASDDAHKKSDVLQACADANLLDRDEWPAQAVTFLNANCH